MQIVEAKNNLVKVSYDTSEENLILSGFVVIKDAVQSFIGQIVNLEANPRGNFVIVKLLFTFNDEGIITNYNGSVPSIKCPMDIVKPNELLELLPIQNPIIIGELAQQKTALKLDRSLFENKLLICAEKEENNEILIRNCAQQLANDGKKVLIIDLNGELDFSANKIIAAENFKLPLNYETINFIYEKGLDDAKAETKAMIQEIFIEVQDYVKTLPEKFIPFETFKDVVDEQYEETELVELVLLKNKLLKYYDEGIFAQKRSEFDSFRNALESPEISILDLSGIDENIQREMISYAYSLINELNEEQNQEVYVFCNINNDNSDKKLLKQILTTKNAYSAIICPYGYKYLKELKQISKDLILFAPIQQQEDFAGYNAFLNKLNVHEFIIYGEATHHLPLIVTLNELPQNEEQLQQPLPQQQPSTAEQDLLDEEIKRDVDEFYTASKPEQEIEQEYEQNEEFSSNEAEEDLTEDDLDFIDDLGVGAEDEEIGNREQGTEDFELLQELSTEDEFSINSASDEIIEEENLEPFNPSTEEEVQPEFIEEAVEEPQFKENIEISEDNNETETFQDILVQQAEQEEESEELQEQISEAPAVDILPVRMSSSPIVPIYSADVEQEANSDDVVQGDTVMHPKYGKGTVEKLINYGSKTLCSINFDNVGRRLLDPALAELKKV